MLLAELKNRNSAEPRTANREQRTQHYRESAHARARTAVTLWEGVEKAGDQGGATVSRLSNHPGSSSV